MKSSARDEAEGKWHKLKGKIKELAGKGTMNRGLEAKGKDEKRAGKAQEKIGQFKKGDERALDYFCSSFDFVGAGIDDRLHHGWSHSCPLGHRHHRGSDPSHSGAKTNVKNDLIVK